MASKRLLVKLKRIWSRLSDRTRWPRRWWHPPTPSPLREDKGAKVVEDFNEAHKQCSETIRRTMLALLASSFYCIVTVFGASDSALLTSGSEISLPFANVAISFVGFLIAGPFLLIVLSIYLHVFLERWFVLRQLVASEKQITTLFNMDDHIARALSGFIFYWLVPLVLSVMTWKVAGRAEWALPLSTVTMLIMSILGFLQIRRCLGNARRWWNPPRWCVLVFLFGAVIWIVAIAETVQFRRSLELSRANLEGAWLDKIDLRMANLDNANLASANLRNAQLQGASLIQVDLSGAQLLGTNLNSTQMLGANLNKAQLVGAKLNYAILGGANATEANLSGASLRYASLVGAQLNKADLTGAVLTNAYLPHTNLTDANLQVADLRGASLMGANLSGVNLEGANLKGAYLRLGHPREATIAAKLADLFKALGESRDAGMSESERELNKMRDTAVSEFEREMNKVKGLTCDQLTKAVAWQEAYRDESLACGGPLPPLPSE